MKAIEWYILTKNSTVRLELMGVTTLMSVVKNAKIFVKTFDGFDVYVNGRLIYFPSSKAKEMLAVLVAVRPRLSVILAVNEILPALFKKPVVRLDDVPEYPPPDIE